MPYRRLPNTDAARLRALESALLMSEHSSPNNLAYNQSTFLRLKKAYTQFKQILDIHQKTYDSRVNANKNYQKAFKKSRMYFSHFIQVLNFAVIRKEIPKTDRKLYDLNINDSRVPEMNTEEDLVKWGHKIIKGEKERLARGGSPIYNPKIAVVNVEFENFLKLHNSQNTFKNSHDASIERLSEIRIVVDNVIVDIWNQVEEYFAEKSGENMRMMSEKYGVKYVLRKKEKLLKGFND